MDAFYQQLGVLGAQLTGAEFGAEQVPPEQLETWLRTARALLESAHKQLERETMKFAENETETTASPTAASATAASATAVVKDTPCVGPCTFLWKGANRSGRVKALMRKMQETESSSDVRALYCELVQLKPEGAEDAQSYQLCQLTGFPCATFTDTQEGQLVPQTCATSVRITQLQECVRESRLMVAYAEHVVYSRLLQAEARALTESPAASSASDVVISGGAGSGSAVGARHAQLVAACEALLHGDRDSGGLRGGGTSLDAHGAARASIAAFYKYVPDFRGHAVRDAMTAFNAVAKSRDPGDALDFLVTGSVVDPLVHRASPLIKEDVRAALTAHWSRHVMSAGANLRSQH